MTRMTMMMTTGEDPAAAGGIASARGVEATAVTATTDITKGRVEALNVDIVLGAMMMVVMINGIIVTGRVDMVEIVKMAVTKWIRNCLPTTASATMIDEETGETRMPVANQHRMNIK